MVLLLVIIHLVVEHLDFRLVGLELLQIQCNLFLLLHFPSQHHLHLHLLTVDVFFQLFFIFSCFLFVLLMYFKHFHMSMNNFYFFLEILFFGEVVWLQTFNWLHKCEVVFAHFCHFVLLFSNDILFLFVAF